MSLLSANPRLPPQDLATIDASYRLMARASLAEARPAAEFVKTLSYGSTAEAASARRPIHLGAIDYFERKQESFVERNDVWMYLVLLFGGVITILEWLRLCLSQVRRERIEAATDKLLKICLDAHKTGDLTTLGQIAREIDDPAARASPVSRARRRASRAR